MSGSSARRLELSLGQRLKLHLLVLPRPFALPVVIVSITLGGLLAGSPLGNLVLALTVGTLLMFYSHVANSWLDWSWTGFDQGPIGQRSKPKPYTSGQNVIETYGMSVREVAAGAFFWLALSGLFAFFLSQRAGPSIWLPWALVVPLTFAYSQAKKFYVPELPLCLGFSTFSVWIGMAAAGQIDFVRGALASIPLFLIWASAELVDQYLDAEVNIGKGLRSLGVIAWGWNALPDILALEIILAYLALWVLVWGNVLSPWAALFSVAAGPFLVFTVAQVTTHTARAIKVGLLGIFLFGALITLGQGIGG